MKILIYGNRHQDNHIGDIISMISSLLEKGDEVVLHPKINGYLEENSPRFSQLTAKMVWETDVKAPADADLAISIGGDGTFLRTAQWIGDAETPIIGVNTGHLGFLAPFTPGEVETEIERFRNGKSSVSSRSLICVDSMGGSLGDEWPYALNEVVLHKRDSASMVTVSARIDRRALADYLCDGLIVATPTGSTAYNLSVGGPIVAPSTPVFTLSPIAAHTLTMRPLVVSDGSLIELTVKSRAKSFRLSLDGRSIQVACGDTLYLSKAPFCVKMVCKPGQDFYSTLRDKLLWGER